MAWSKNYSKFDGRSWWWHAMWQTCYLSAELLWNPKADYDALLLKYQELSNKAENKNETENGVENHA